MRSAPRDEVTRTAPSSVSAVLDLGGHDLDAIAAEFHAAAGAQVRRVEAIVAEDAVHLMRGVVARLGTVEHQDASARSAEHERGV